MLFAASLFIFCLWCSHRDATKWIPNRQHSHALTHSLFLSRTPTDNLVDTRTNVTTNELLCQSVFCCCSCPFPWTFCKLNGLLLFDVSGSVCVAAVVVVVSWCDVNIAFRFAFTIEALNDERVCMLASIRHIQNRIHKKTISIALVVAFVWFEVNASPRNRWHKQQQQKRIQL